MKITDMHTQPNILPFPFVTSSVGVLRNERYNRAIENINIVPKQSCTFLIWVLYGLIIIFIIITTTKLDKKSTSWINGCLWKKSTKKIKNHLNITNITCTIIACFLPKCKLWYKILILLFSIFWMSTSLLHQQCSKDEVDSEESHQCRSEESHCAAVNFNVVCVFKLI